MNKLEEAIIYATQMHQGKVRKVNNIPYILHPLEVAQIISTMTEDQEVIAAGVLHDIVEDTEGTLEEIRRRFGERVAIIVEAETENKYEGESKAESWVKRKEESLRNLKNCTDVGVKMLWLADKLSNIRSLAGAYSEQGGEVWKSFNQTDPQMHQKYYQTVAKHVEIDLNRTGAFKEFIKHINFIWPGTYDTEKTKYKKYKEVSIDGCALIGHGAKGDVYRYDDELIIKVYNENNTYQDVEQEIALSRKAFVLGLPTAISFGIVAVGNRYGAMFELVDSSSVSSYIAANPERVDEYAVMMADVARIIHSTKPDDDSFPDGSLMLMSWVTEGLAYVDTKLADRLLSLIDALPEAEYLVHGDFHTGNVLMYDGEPLLIDLDRLSAGPPILDLSGLYMAYIANGEHDPRNVEKFMGFSYETGLRFFDSFMKEYFKGENEIIIKEAIDKAALMCYARMIRKIRKKNDLTEQDEIRTQEYVSKISKLLERVSTLRI